MTLTRKLLCSVGIAFEKPLFFFQNIRRSAAVLVYHRVSPETDKFYSPISPTILRQQLELIKRYLTILPLDELIQRFESGLSIRGCCSITFDDGYADFLTYAYPILKDLGIPAVHFVTTEGVNLGRVTWNYRLNRALYSLKLSNNYSFSPRNDDTPSWAELMQAKRLVDNLSRHEREALLCKMESLTCPTFNPRMLTAKDLCAVDSSIVEWGSHTVSHSTLIGRESEELYYELANSRIALESILNTRVKFLAYPNGVADTRAMGMAAKCGYKASFLSDYQRRMKLGMPIHGIPRIDAGTLPVNMLGLELAGVTPFARNSLRRSKGSLVTTDTRKNT